jgi:hypothetical protein
LFGKPLSLEGDLDLELDLEFGLELRRPGDTSLPEPMGDFGRLSNFRDFGTDLLAKNVSSSIADTDVAAVAVEFERCENLVMLLSPVPVVWVVADDRLIEDFDRL